MTERPKDPNASWDEGTLEFAGLSRVRLDALLQELLGRVDEIMDSQERLRALLDAVVGIGADLDLNSTLDRIVTAACKLVGARYGALGVVGPDGKRLSRFITHGVDAEQIAAIGPYPEGHGILGHLIEHPEPLRLTDLSEHPRSFGFPPNHPPMKSFLGVPIRTRDYVFGNLYLTEKPDHADFTEDDERTVTALAAAAGVVIDNARLYADTERRRRWHEVTAEITQLMLGEFDPQEALQLIATRAREVSGSLVGAVLLRADDHLVVEALDGPAPFQRFLGRADPARPARAHRHPRRRPAGGDRGPGRSLQGPRPADRCARARGTSAGPCWPHSPPAPAPPAAYSSWPRPTGASARRHPWHRSGPHVRQPGHARPRPCPGPA